MSCASWALTEMLIWLQICLKASAARSSKIQGGCSSALICPKCRNSLRQYLKHNRAFNPSLLKRTASSGLTQLFSFLAADQRKPAENVQGAVEPLSGLSETEKAKRRKAKKARQRAAQAQAAARPAEVSSQHYRTLTLQARSSGTENYSVRGALLVKRWMVVHCICRATPALHWCASPQQIVCLKVARPCTLQASEVGSKEPVEDSLGRASKGEQSAEEQAAEWAPQTDKDIDSPMFPAPVSPSTPRENSDSREVAASSRSSSLSSHLSLRQHNGMATQQQELSPPILAAPAAQASALAVQEEEQPWQEVRTSRRRPVRQHAASRAGANEPPRQGRSAPDLEAAAQSASWPRILQAAAQPAEQASMSSDRAVVPPHAQLGQGSAEWLPEWLAAISGSQPQRPPQQNGLDTLQPSGSHDASSSSVQPENSQALPDSTAPDEPCMITQQMPQPGLQFESFSPEQVRVLWLNMMHILRYSRHIRFTSVSSPSAHMED